MLSPTAIAELAEIRAHGLTPTDADIVRINALALKAEYAEDSCEIFAAPRVAWLCGQPIYEPTIQAMLWLAEHGNAIASDSNTYQLLALWAYAHGRIPRFFERRGMTAALIIKMRVTVWLHVSGVAAATVAQVANVMEYVRYGNRPESGEYPPSVVAKAKALYAEASDCDLIHRRLHDAFALLGGGSTDECKTMTLSALDHIILRAELNAGGTLEGAQADALGDLYAASAEIIDRLTKERDQHGA